MKPLARLLLLVILTLSSVAASAAPPDRGGRGRGGYSPDSGADVEWMAQRRERMRNIREDMQRQQDGWPRGGGRQGFAPGPFYGFEGDPYAEPDGRGRRRLSPEERQRLRRDLRDAEREVYIRR